MLVYHSLAGSKLRYGLICWSTASKYLLNKVDKAHNKIITYMTFQKRCSSMWPLYCQLKVLPLDLLIKIEFGKTVYKHKNNMLPQAFDHYFKGGGTTRFSDFGFSGTFFALVHSFLVRFGQTKYQCDQTSPLYKNIKKLIFSHYDVIGESPKMSEIFFLKIGNSPMTS